MGIALEHVNNLLTKITGQNLEKDSIADIDNLALFEKSTQTTLPQDFKQFLLTAPQSFHFFEYQMLNIDGIRDNWRILNELEAQGEFQNVTPWYLSENKKIQQCWWNKSWIPFAIDAEDNLLCIDLAPLSQGSFGQVFYWQTIGGPHLPKTASFTAFLTWYENELLNGHYYFDKENNVLEEIFDEKQFLNDPII